jgi:hypothetical protein
MFSKRISSMCIGGLNFRVLVDVCLRRTHLLWNWKVCLSWCTNTHCFALCVPFPRYVDNAWVIRYMTIFSVCNRCFWDVVQEFQILVLVCLNHICFGFKMKNTIYASALMRFKFAFGFPRSCVWRLVWWCVTRQYILVSARISSSGRCVSQTNTLAMKLKSV